MKLLINGDKAANVLPGMLIDGSNVTYKLTPNAGAS